MIAAIERARQCVWGIGPTPSSALRDAHKQIEGKPNFKVKATDLECVPLKPGTDFGLDGEALWHACILKAAPTQHSLF